METGALVRQTATELGLLDAEGKLRVLDSLEIIDFVIALEKAMGVTVPSSSMDPETFSSVDSVVAMLNAAKASAEGSSSASST